MPRTPRTPRTEPHGARRLRVGPAEFARQDFERRERIDSIFSAPEDELVPGSLAELILMALAWANDVRVYASGGRLTGTWVVWLGRLAEVRAGQDGRVTLAEWRAHWPALLAEMGYGDGAYEALMADAGTEAPVTQGTPVTQGVPEGTETPR